MPTTPFLTADVFTDRPFAGNQLAVFTEAMDIPDGLLQPIALEMGFSETVFVYPPADGGSARIRIFTPGRELPFAGHPVLGTAIAIAIARGIERVALETARGTVAVATSDVGERGGFAVMSQPIPTVAPCPQTEAVLAALGAGGSALPVEVYDNGIPHAFIALPDAAAVSRLQPDMDALDRLARRAGAPIGGFNCFAADGGRWKTRMFAPASGVPEDAATGSAAGPLAFHLARHGVIAFGERIEISQGAELGRPSTLYATAIGSAEAITAVEVGGTAVLVTSGLLRLPE